MALPLLIEQVFIQSVDYIFSRRPQPSPGKERLLRCKMVAHRGAYDNRMVFENTIPAFDKIAAAGIWGIELDVRWTRDLIPVVFHDKDLLRVFRSPLEVSQLTRAELKRSFPLIPSLAEIVARYGNVLHLMVELKEGYFPNPPYQSRVLQDLFAALTPRRDYHWLALNPRLFDHVDFVCPDAFLPVAEINVCDISQKALHYDYQGICGHYLLITRRLIARHRHRGQRVGTGFVNSVNCLKRELNRGVEWLFTQNPLRLQAALSELLERFS